MSAVQTMLANTWRGLVQRRLLPVAALLLAALVAVPLLLSSDPEPVTPADGVAASRDEVMGQPIVAVASAAEREGDRRVLGDRNNPFKPVPQPKVKKSTSKSTGSGGVSGGMGALAPGGFGSGGSGASSGDSGAGSGGSGAGSGGSSGSGSTSGGSPTSGGGSNGAAPGGSDPNGGGSPSGSTPAPDPTATPNTGPLFKAYSLMVRFGSSGDEALVESNLDRLAALPSPDEPVLIYLGMRKDRKTAVFLVDAGVTTQGDGTCNPDPEHCETLELRAGETAFFDVPAKLVAPAAPGAPGGEAAPGGAATPGADAAPGAEVTPGAEATPGAEGAPGEEGAVTQYQLDLVKVIRRKTASAKPASAKPARASSSRAAKGGRAALREMLRERPAFSFDKDSGLLELVTAARRR